MSSLSQECSPRTMVGRIRCLKQAMRLSVVKGMRGVEPAVEAWRHKHRRLVAVLGARRLDAGQVVRLHCAEMLQMLSLTRSGR